MLLYTEDVALVVFVWLQLNLAMFSLFHIQRWRPDQSVKGVKCVGATFASPSTHDILNLALILGEARNLDSFVIRYDLCAFKFIFVYEEVDLEILLMFTLRDLKEQCFSFSPAEVIKIKSSIDLENKIRAACEYVSSIS